MDLLQIAVLALIQGLTEFLPISSSAHLILAPKVLGYADQGLAFDVAVHVGTLAAVVSYFRQEVIGISREFSVSLGSGSPLSANARLGWMIVWATLPIVVFGLLLKEQVAGSLRSPLGIAATTIGFGILLWIFDVRGKRVRDEYSIRWKDAVIIGLFQAMAIIPGTSRSGSTITAGLLLGLTRQAASRFSFLLSIPAILMSGALVTWDLLESTAPVDWTSLLIGASLSFVVAYLTIHYFLRFIEQISMLPFVLNRMILGIAILILVL